MLETRTLTVKPGVEKCLVLGDSIVVSSITSAVVCDVLEHKYFMNYGVPKSLVSDNAYRYLW